MTQHPDMSSLDAQATMAIIALAAALCKQPGIDGQKLRLDFLDAVTIPRQSRGHSGCEPLEAAARGR